MLLLAAERRSVGRHTGIMINWEAIGAVGEIAGAIAVIATIFYLSLQIRQNSRSLDRANEFA